MFAGRSEVAKSAFDILIIEVSTRTGFQTTSVVPAAFRSLFRELLQHLVVSHDLSFFEK
jgi:hypothetical protein